MASKVHVDNVVNERRLRPIYDWLDYGNNKKALQEADKVLRKQPGHQCARVLKALALLRLGKETECQVIMDKVRLEVPCEDSTLQAMSICYREIHRPDKISEVYEAAAKADPNNEELLTHLFMSYVRLGDFKKQQHTAMALYKLVPKNPYYFWAVMSIVMQAVQADENIAKRVTLPLAERMVLKLVNEGKIEAEQEVQLYLMILELQGKDEEVLKVLGGPLASRVSNLEPRKAKLLLKMQQYAEAVSAFKELIRQDADNWTFYKDYLSAALKCQSLGDCLKFLDETAAVAGKKSRAPQLARLELFNTARESQIDCPFSHVEDMHKYFNKFGSKGCVVSELKMYLHLLSTPEKDLLLEKIEKDIGVSKDGYPESVDQMQRYIHFNQLRRLCGMHHFPKIDLEEMKKLVLRFCHLYKKGNELCPEQERLTTDYCPADAYILLATHLLHQLWHETGEAEYLYRAMDLLERCLASSTSNFHVKILLVRIYLEAGFIGAADYAFVLLDAKHIQLDSLGFLHTPLLAPLGLLSHASHNLEQTAKFFVGNSKDSADHLTFAYKYGSFLKIQEFVDLKERLEKSIHFATTTVDKMLIELTRSEDSSVFMSALGTMHIEPSEDLIKWDLLRDNRDLEVIVGWEPIHAKDGDPRMRKETKECMLSLLRARNLILRILASVAESNTTFLFTKLSQDMRTLVRESIPAVLQNFWNEDGKDKVNTVIIPIDAVMRLREMYDSEQLIAIACLAESLSLSPYPDETCIEILRKSPSIQLPSIPEQEKPIAFTKFFLRASTCGETLSILGSICVAVISLLKSQNSQKKNKKKQNKENVKISPEISQFASAKALAELYTR
ncbi:N-alpha-acetyltransferase 25, NatB auxiliary subunit isoform X2 [Belonocnema kinseyi]|uniref:N-alpha-acetyltransferase 25, NatB auxiliary subunit isoform X2 n=1 Tax=Belonocnema kinseyi TaxID=2817044 RepID=UPI00143D28B6|nr:N-alpha-acetyltransferase 25, NatB auxiliary subunit isoform X2 [Belonocnema kinseyi]